MIRVLAQLDPALEGFAEGDQVGNPLYAIVDRHAAALLAALLLPMIVWATVQRGAAARRQWAVALLEGFRALPTARRVLVWLLIVSGAVHLGLVFGHGASGYTALFLVAAGGMFYVARRLVLHEWWRAPAAVVLIGSILAYAVVSVAGEPPDQLGLATKLVELVALGLVLTPRPNRRVRRLLASTSTGTLVVITGMGAWIGAFSTAGEEGGHHGGEFPEPGTVVPYVLKRPPTDVESYTANGLYAATVAAVAKYQDPAMAAADGYQVEGMVGTDFHAQNPAYVTDGRIFDPERPETLVYAVTSDGPVLLGAMFEMPDIGTAGPQVGGPLTVWHSHENVCFSLLPPALSGLVSPFGVCPAGSLAIPITGQMIHVWTMPGVPDQFGHLDEEWLAAYLDGA